MAKRLLYVFLPVIILSAAGYLVLRSWVIHTPPVVTETSVLQKEVTKISDSLSVLDSNWLHHNDKGLYELYIKGNPYDRGVIAGKLSKDLVYYQEKVFIDQINYLIPSQAYQRFLRLLIAIFNADMDAYVPQEYLREIYGVSSSACADFNYVGPAYDRMMQYHGAHDIGHMLQNYNLVGCTSFAVWGDKSADGSLTVGRNFDFTAGDLFAKNKIIEFCKPDSGYGFMMVTWGGMCGVVSGMNEEGLTVTINAAKSAIPFSAAEPVSLIAREMLQYASGIDEAYAIAAKRNCFVSESYMIGSAHDNCAAVVEKSPYKTALYKVTGNQIVCTNHFQSASFRDDSMNIRHIRRSASLYRYHRVEELLKRYDSLTVYDVARILRDRRGLNDADIGMGNEKAVNQLIAHHSVIFKPALGLAWVSTEPYQLGEYICYDLHHVLRYPERPAGKTQVYKKELSLPPDPFFKSSGWQKFIEFRKRSYSISTSSGKEGDRISGEDLDEFISLNPEYFYTYEICGDYCLRTKDPGKAMKYFHEAMKKEIPTMEEKERIENKLKKCQE